MLDGDEVGPELGSLLGDDDSSLDGDELGSELANNTFDGSGEGGEVVGSVAVVVFENVADVVGCDVAAPSGAGKVALLFGAVEDCGPISSSILLLRDDGDSRAAERRMPLGPLQLRLPPPKVPIRTMTKKIAVHPRKMRVAMLENIGTCSCATACHFCRQPTTDDDNCSNSRMKGANSTTESPLRDSTVDSKRV